MRSVRPHKDNLRHMTCKVLDFWNTKPYFLYHRSIAHGNQHIDVKASMRKGGRYALGQATRLYGFGFGIENDIPTASIQVEICSPWFRIWRTRPWPTTSSGHMQDFLFSRCHSLLATSSSHRTSWLGDSHPCQAVFRLFSLWKSW